MPLYTPVTGGGNAVGYSWRMSEPSDRALWIPESDNARRTFGTTTDYYGRDVLSATIVQDAGPPVSWAASIAGNTAEAVWHCSDIPVLAGDIVQFSFVAGWTRTANSLAETDSAPHGDPGYSVSQDRNGTMMRISADLYLHDSYDSYYSAAVMEPQINYWAAGWVYNDGYYHSLPAATVVAHEDCMAEVYARIGPAWANLAGVFELVSASMTVTSPS